MNAAGVARAASRDARAQQLVKAARDARMPGHEIHSAVELAAVHASEATKDNRPDDRYRH
jgi:hypothetical protein